MKNVRLIIVLTLTCLLAISIAGNASDNANDDESIPTIRDLPYLERMAAGLVERVPPPNYIPKRLGHYSATDWQAVIDSTWGPGLPAPAKSFIWSSFWSKLNLEYACFRNLTVNWDSIGNLYNTANVDYDTISLGRFSAMLTHSIRALREGHTQIIDSIVNVTSLDPGVPLMVIGGWGDNGHFGAGLTPLADSTLLVYNVVENHPLGLEPGDLVLGYDGIPWPQLAEELLEAELPIVWQLWGASEKTHWHSIMKCAGMNWHLFDTIDVVKYSTGDTLHLATAPLDTADMFILAEEIIDPPEIPCCQGSAIRSTMLDSGRIAYMQVKSWLPGLSVPFANTVSMFMDTTTAGMIIDFRTNYGGAGTPEWNAGLALLFDEDVTALGGRKRTSPVDRLAMGTVPGFNESIFTMIADSSTFYDKPIAVLTGPGCWSRGDFVNYMLSFHPRVKYFGKSTRGAFIGRLVNPQLGNGILSRFTDVNLVMLEDTSQYMVHINFPDSTEFPDVPYEEVWLTRDGAAQGVDDVIAAAKAWIASFDADLDGIPDSLDNCPSGYNPNQDDLDGDLFGDACDNCPDHFNPLQEDGDSNGIGDSCECFVVMTGDVNESSSLTSADIIYLVGFVFKSGSDPQPCQAAGDANCSGSVTSADIIYLVGHVFKSGPEPCDVCTLVPSQWACP